MSRIGKRPITIPSGATVTVSGQQIKAKGPKGELAVDLPEQVTIEQGDGQLSIKPRDESKTARSMWGLSRTLANNIVVGVTEGYDRVLEIQGVGYRAAMKGKDLQLQLGFSHEVVHKIPQGITVAVSGAKQEIITVSGNDKQQVGQVAADIRSYRPPEPYQGKGVRYRGEYILRKEGKKK
ncbi:MAG: 50S ribosomal protein L6 [Pseudomonadota bacterium]